jgi:hypothetical protein
MHDGIYRAILMVMVATVMFGALLAIAGETVLARPDISRLGVYTALVGAAIYVVFRWLGAREAARRRDSDDPDDGPDDGGRDSRDP